MNIQATRQHSWLYVVYPQKLIFYQNRIKY